MADTPSPTLERKPTVPEVWPLVRAYYAKPGNEVGGALHVVLDDGNVDDASVRLAMARATVRHDADGEALAGLLLRMSRTQRMKLARMVYFPEAFYAR